MKQMLRKHSFITAYPRQADGRQGRTPRLAADAAAPWSRLSADQLPQHRHRGLVPGDWHEQMVVIEASKHVAADAGAAERRGKRGGQADNPRTMSWTRNGQPDQDGMIFALLQVLIDRPAGAFDKGGHALGVDVVRRLPGCDQVLVADAQVDLWRAAGSDRVTYQDSPFAASSASRVSRRRLPSHEPPRPRFPHKSRTTPSPRRN